jgi:diguanylate cyclase (GGDEF)-like protein
MLGWRLSILLVVTFEFLNLAAAPAGVHPAIAGLSPTIGFAAFALWTFAAAGLTMIMSAKERGIILALGDLVVAALATLAMPFSSSTLLLYSLPALDVSALGAIVVIAVGVLCAAAYPVVLQVDGLLPTLFKSHFWYLAGVIMSVTCSLVLQVQQRQEAQAQAVLSVIRTSQELGTSASLDNILTVASRDIKSLFDCSTCVIYLREGTDLESTFLRVARAETPKEKIFIEFDLDQKKSIIQEVMISKQAALVEDFQAYPGEEVIRRDPLFRATLVCPLLFETHALGAIFVSHHQSRYYQVGALHLLTLLANQLGVAVRNVQLQRTTETLAITDSLSGLFTHGHFQSTLDEELKKARNQTKNPLSLLILDLDFFKKVNDTYGHPQGDSLLKQLGGIIKRISRPTDVVCRYGGDEFTVIMPNTPHDEAALLAEKIRAAVEEYEFALGRQLVRVTLSGGVATFPQDAIDKLELVSKADQAMYQAKQHGRNRVVKQGSGRRKFEAVGGNRPPLEGGRGHERTAAPEPAAVGGTAVAERPPEAPPAEENATEAAAE